MRVFLTMLVALSFVVTASANMLANPGFESGDLTGWSTDGGTWTLGTTDPSEGTYDIEYAATISDERLFQAVTLTAGQLYTLTCDYRVDTASVDAQGWRFAQLGFHDGSPQWGNYVARDTIDDESTTAGWVQASVAYTPTTSGTYYVGFSSWQTDAVYGLDNFSLVPEPATLGLLSLGGLAMLKKRRCK